MQRTQATHELTPVQIEHTGAISHVWLRRNVERVTVETEDGTQGAWEADEAHGTLSGHVTEEYVTERFARLWAAFEEADLTDRELMELRADTLGDGLAEIAGIAAEVADELEVHAQAIEELASIIGGE